VYRLKIIQKRNIRRIEPIQFNFFEAYFRRKRKTPKHRKDFIIRCFLIFSLWLYEIHQTPEQRISKPGGSLSKKKIELEKNQRDLISRSKILIRVLKGVVEKDSDFYSGFIFRDLNNGFNGVHFWRSFER